MIHSLKILPNYFKDVESGVKPFEVRKYDRNYKVDDILILDEWNGEYTGNICRKQVTYVLIDNNFCKEGYCILGIKDY